MTENISEEVLERLEAEVLTADADAEELTLAVKSDLEQKDEQIEELQDDVEAKDAEVEELQNMVSEKEDRIEELQDEVTSVAETYAEELAEESAVLDKEDLLDKFEFEELREKYEDLEVKSDPDPSSGDPGAGVQGPDDEVDDTPDEPELSETEELAAEQWRERAATTGKEYWNDLAEEIESSD